MEFRFTFLLFNFLALVLGRPLSKLPLSPRDMPSVDALNFMQRYGYLQPATKDTQALYSEEAVVDAIKTVQKFGAIPQTGKVDNDTLQLMKSRRCGLPDVIRSSRSKRFVLGSQGWKKRHLTYFISNWSPKLGEETVAKYIQLSLDMWGRYGRLQFTRVHHPDADIVVLFAREHHGDNFPFDGLGSILAHAFFPSGYHGLSGDIHFDDDEDWVIGESDDGTDFFMVAVHELGHSMGLSHSADKTSIMFPYYKGYSTDLSLGYDDILGMYELYIKGGSDIEDHPSTETTTRFSDFDHTTPQRRWNDFDHTTHSTPRHGWNDFDRTTHTHTSDIDETTRYHNPWGSNENTNPPFHGDDTSRRRDEHSTVSYEGDYESVDDHQRHEGRREPPRIPPPSPPGDPSPPSRSPQDSSIPDICDGHFDAVATLRRELFIFKNRYIWRLKEKHHVEQGYPVPVTQMFPKLPSDIDHVDAAYERPDGMIILFTGDRYWVYNGQDFIENSPQPLTNYGLPAGLNSIDAVQTWGRNGKTYFYKHDRFWRYNETMKAMDPDYPKHMERWRGVPHDLDAATTWKDGYTYFFKDKYFWKFDNKWVITTPTSPLPSPQIWLGCPEMQDIRDYFLREPQ